MFCGSIVSLSFQLERVLAGGVSERQQAAAAAAASTFTRDLKYIAARVVPPRALGGREVGCEAWGASPILLDGLLSFLLAALVLQSVALVDAGRKRTRSRCRHIFGRPESPVSSRCLAG